MCVCTVRTWRLGRSTQSPHSPRIRFHSAELAPRPRKRPGGAECGEEAIDTGPKTVDRATPQIRTLSLGLRVGVCRKHILHVLCALFRETGNMRSLVFPRAFREVIRPYYVFRLYSTPGAHEIIRTSICGDLSSGRRSIRPHIRTAQALRLLLQLDESRASSVLPIIADTQPTNIHTSYTLGSLE
ncbi:hypothetical protein BD309DRAFT_349777 [Dichomitus squalens]|nr:hypothetical protein BD309DRAFT_349777 [Dichomitus squalens]